MGSQSLQRLSILIWFIGHTLALVSAESKKAVSIFKGSLILQQYHAAHESSQALLDFLIKNPERINKSDAGGWLPLAIMAERGECALVTSLLEKKADVNLKCFGDMTPLHMVGGEAFYLYPIDIDQLLIGYNHPEQRYTCKDEKADCMKLLLKAKADVKAIDGRNNTPLAYAIGRYCPEQVKVLLAAGALMPEKLIRDVIQACNEEENPISQHGIQDCIEVMKTYHNTNPGMFDRIEAEVASKQSSLSPQS